VFDRRQASTARLAQSMIATRYRKPWPIGTYAKIECLLWEIFPTRQGSA
jgi:hypothetical protein